MILFVFTSTKWLIGTFLCHFLLFKRNLFYQQSKKLKIKDFTYSKCIYKFLKIKRIILVLLSLRWSSLFRNTILIKLPNIFMFKHNLFEIIKSNNNRINFTTFTKFKEFNGSNLSSQNNFIWILAHSILLSKQIE